MFTDGDLIPGTYCDPICSSFWRMNVIFVIVSSLSGLHAAMPRQHRLSGPSAIDEGSLTVSGMASRSSIAPRQQSVNPHPYILLLIPSSQS